MLVTTPRYVRVCFSWFKVSLAGFVVADPLAPVWM